MPFGQLVIGAPGSGKTTYCSGLQQILSGIERETVFINLDPANDSVPYQADLDIRSICSMEDIMEKEVLGPNGALIRSLELLEEEFDDWFVKRFCTAEESSDAYFVFDCPGQVELFTTHSTLRNIIEKLTRRYDFRLVTIQLIDITLCLDASKWLAGQLLCLRSMLLIEAPHINVLTKIDLATQFNLPFRLEHYCEGSDIFAGEKLPPKYEKLHRALLNLLDDFGLVRFVPLAVEDKDAMLFLIGEVDRASGLVFGGLTEGNESIFESAVTEKTWDDLIHTLETRYFSHIDKDIVDKKQ
jgi:GTPase SAR1 family protein